MSLMQFAAADFVVTRFSPTAGFWKDAPGTP
jgi:hypothetical protein